MCDISGYSKDRDHTHTHTHTHIDIGISPYDREVITDKYSDRFV